MFGAEPWTEAPEARDGLHVQEDHFLVEVVDPKTGTLIPDGTYGELVFTTLTKEALPLLRYRTGDIASLTRERCACGRTFARMSAVRGRRDDMLIVRGANLYPSQIEHVLLAQEGIAPHYQLVVERPQQLDEVTVHCEPAGGDTDTDPDALAARVHEAIRQRIGISVTVEIRAPGEVPRSEGKAVRVIDRRT
jgi:phenylacetate-CoA ligase